MASRSRKERRGAECSSISTPDRSGSDGSRSSPGRAVFKAAWTMAASPISTSYSVTLRSARPTPRPVEAFPCGSESISSTRSPTAARAVPRLIAVVVLPTPPFWLATTRTRRAGSDLAGTVKPLHTHDAPAGVALGWHDVGLIFPISSGFTHISYHILSFEEQAGGAALKVWPGIPEQAVKRRTSPRGDDLHS